MTDFTEGRELKKPILKRVKKVTKHGIVTNKMFWKFIKPFLANRGHERNNIMLIKYDKIVSEENDLAETFNKNYINIVENSSGIRSYNVALENSVSEDNAAIGLVIKFYENHPSITKNKQKIRRDLRSK